MKKIPSRCGLILICLVAGSQAALAATQEQSATVTFNNAGHLISGSGSGPLVDGTLFTGTFTPFDAALGTLTACTVTFSATTNLSGTADAQAGADGSLGATLGGTFYLDTHAFNGTGNVLEPVTAAPGNPLAGTLVLDGFSYAFRPENAGLTYDPALLQIITGQQAFVYEFRPTANVVNYTNAVDLAISVNGVLKLTYEYEPAPAPPVITGLVRQTGTGDVTLTWTSASGSRYAVEASANLNAWSTVAADVAAAAGGETSWTETGIPATPGQRFYRVRKTN
jgi:hypothetical protein